MHDFATITSIATIFITIATTNYLRLQKILILNFMMEMNTY